MNQKNAKPPLGQHFLKNNRALSEIIAALELKRGELVIEIGPGKGVLTVPLAEACKKVGCSLLAIEKDKALAQELEQKLATSNFPPGEDPPLEEKLEIVLGDVLKVLPSIVHDWKLPARQSLDAGGEIVNWKLVGNIPYYITGTLLRTVSELPQKPARTVLTVQREVAERIISKPPRMNLLAAAVQIWASPEILMTLKPDDFSPPPKVDSAILLLTTNDIQRTTEEADYYYFFIRKLFKQPRKTTLNNIRSGYPKKTNGEIQKQLETHGIQENARPQDISMPVLIKLASYFSH